MGVVSKKATQNIIFLSPHFRRDFSGRIFIFHRNRLSSPSDRVERSLAQRMADEEGEENKIIGRDVTACLRTTF